MLLYCCNIHDGKSMSYMSFDLCFTFQNWKRNQTDDYISICIGKQFSYFEQNGEVGTSSICQCRKIQQNLSRESISLEVQVLLLLLDIAISELNIQTKAYIATICDLLIALFILELPFSKRKWMLYKCIVIE